MNALTAAHETRPAVVDWVMRLRVTALVGAVAVGVVAQGGFYSRGRWSVLAVLGAVALLTPWDRLDALDRRLIAAVATVTAWMGVEVLRGGSATAATAVVVTVVASVLAFSIGRRLATVEATEVVQGFLILGCIVAVIGAAGVAAHREPWAGTSQSLWRAAAGLSYANATGALLVMLALVALALSSASPRSPWYAVAGAVLLGGAAATLSRGAALAGAVGLVVLVGLAGLRSVPRLVGPLTGSLLMVASLVPSMPAANEPRPWLGMVGLAAGVGVAAGLARWNPSLRVARLLAGVGTLTAAAAGWTLLPSVQSRLTAQSPRWDAWAATWTSVIHHPLAGVGPGRLTVTWRDGEGVARSTGLVHNEYLQTVAELGLVGAGVVLVVAALVLTALRAALRRPFPPLAVGAAAACAAFAIQSSTDFLWHLTVLPVLGCLLVALATTRPQAGSTSIAHRKEHQA